MVRMDFQLDTPFPKVSHLLWHMPRRKLPFLKRFPENLGASALPDGGLAECYHLLPSVTFQDEEHATVDTVEHSFAAVRPLDRF
jgi:hypothetical protein